jgi:elongator complex protein 1
MLNCYRRAQWPAESTAAICDAVRRELETKDYRKYINSILTAHVVKTPPDHEGALNALARLQGTLRFSANVSLIA